MTNKKPEKCQLHYLTKIFISNAKALEDLKERIIEDMENI